MDTIKRSLEPLYCREMNHRRSLRSNSDSDVPSFHDDLLKPVKISLIPLGLNECTEKRDASPFERIKSNLNLRVILCLIGVHGVVVHTLSNSCYYAIKRHQFSLAFGNLAGLLRALSAAVSLDYFIVNKEAIYNCMLEVDKLRYDYFVAKKVDVVPGKKWCKISVVLFWLYFVFKVVFPISFAAHLEPKFYIEMFLYDFPLLHGLTPTMQRVACCCELILYQCIVGIRDFVQLVVTCTVGVMCRKINRFVEAMRDPRLSDSQTISICHTDVFALSKKLDANFRLLYFAWMCEWMTSLILNFPKLLTNKKTDNLFANVLSYMDILGTFLVSVVVSVTLSEMTCKQDSLLSAVHHRVSRQNIADTSKKGQIFGSYLIVKVSTGKLCMTIFECFVVTKTFIISLYGAVLTYVMFIAQELQKEAF